MISIMLFFVKLIRLKVLSQDKWKYLNRYFALFSQKTFSLYLVNTSFLKKSYRENVSDHSLFRLALIRFLWCQSTGCSVRIWIFNYSISGFLWYFWPLVELLMPFLSIEMASFQPDSGHLLTLLLSWLVGCFCK